ncbi:MAG TPA: Beta-galactosidase C-terminal domain [Erysipelothrix sp.]|nr:Beta-galactosidase C-terminal domain [Erysipelothrix sp.]
MKHFSSLFLEKTNIKGLGDTPKDVEVSKRIHENGDEVFFIINHNNKEVEISGVLEGEIDLLSGAPLGQKEILAPFDVKIIKVEK